MQEKIHQTEDNFSQRLSKRMLTLGLTQAQLSQKLGVGQSSVHRWLHGSEPHRRMIRELAKELSVTEEWLSSGRGITPDFQDHLSMLSEVRDESMAGGGGSDQQQQQFDSGMRVKDESWRMRAFELEKKLLQVRHDLLRLADQIHEPPRSETGPHLTDGPDEYRTPDKPKP